MQERPSLRQHSAPLLKQEKRIGDVVYTTHYPSESFNKTTRLGREIIYTIARLPLADAVETMRGIVDEINIRILNDTKWDAFKKPLGELKSFDTSDLNQVLKILALKRGEIQKLSTSKFDETAIAQQLSNDMRELHAWVEGIFLHASIMSKRQEIQQILANKTKNVPHPVKEIKEQITDGEDKAFKAIAKMCPKQSLPIILHIMHEWNAMLKLPCAEETISAMKAVLDYLDRMEFNCNNMVLTGLAAEARPEAKDKDSKLISELKTFVGNIRKIDVSPETVALAREACIWLKNAHLRKISLLESSAFYLITGLLVSDLVSNVTSHYQQAALALHAKISLVENRQPEGGLARLFAAAPVVPASAVGEQAAPSQGPRG